MPGFLLGQFYHFFITSDNSGTIRCQFIIIGDNSVSVHHYCGQFGISSSLSDNSVSVHHYGQFGVSSSLLLPLHQVGKLDSGAEDWVEVISHRLGIVREPRRRGRPPREKRL